MPYSVSSITLLFVCAAAWTVIAAACGGFFALWCCHVGRTNCHPLPKVPSITLFRRKPKDDDDDEPQPGNSNGNARRGSGIGP